MIGNVFASRLRLFTATAAVAFFQMTTVASQLHNDNNIFANKQQQDFAMVLDPTVVADAIEEKKASYKELRQLYTKEGCLEKWGPFPESAEKSLDEVPEDLSNGVICTCGMMHDLAATMVVDYIDEAVASHAALADVSLADGSLQLSLGDVEFSAVDTSASISKLTSWAMARTPISEVPCVDGFAAIYPCNNVDLVAYLPLVSLLTTNTLDTPFQANDVWGWTNSDGDREFVIWGVREGHYFLEVTDAVNPKILGFLPANTSTAFQHDMKVIGDFAYMGAEAFNHGLQIFDMKRLLDPPNCVNDKYCVELTPDVLYTGTDTYPVGNTHNIVANSDSQYIYLVGGSNGCRGGLHVVDVEDPLNPKFEACFGEDGYVHDAHCVYYNGPDSKYADSEICFCFNEDTLTIVDVSDKSDISIISRTGYEGQYYTHQGWLSTDHAHVIFGDEADELRRKLEKTKTYVVNLEDLENPGKFQHFDGTTAAIDHNLYTIKATAEGQDYEPSKFANTDLIYQANYKAGLRIQQVIDYEKAEVVEVGYFDTFPESNERSFAGAWSSFPYFKSGVIAVSSIENGLFLVKPNLANSLIRSGSLTPAPTAPPTAPPTIPSSCADSITLAFRDNEKKNCRWVGRPKKKIRLVKRKCRKKWQGKRLKDFCPETCGKVGLGVCKRFYTDLELGLAV